MELVYTTDLKSVALRLAGSSPAFGTIHRETESEERKLE